MTTIGTDPDVSAERLGSRFDEIKRRFHDAKLKFDVRGYIASNPWRAIAFGALAGVILGSFGGREPAKRREPGRSKITEAAIAGISTLGMTLLRELASSQLKSLFAKWEGSSSQPTSSPYAG